MVTILGKDLSCMKEVTCRNCASKLSYTESETRSETRSCCGDMDVVNLLTCPCCGKDIEVR